MPTKSSVVHSNPEILSGTSVFVGTRVPVESLFDYIEGGDTLDEFLRQFPSKREQAIAVLELARDTLLTRARSARTESSTSSTSRSLPTSSGTLNMQWRLRDAIRNSSSILRAFAVFVTNLG